MSEPIFKWIEGIPCYIHEAEPLELILEPWPTDEELREQAGLGSDAPIYMVHYWDTPYLHRSETPSIIECDWVRFNPKIPNWRRFKRQENRTRKQRQRLNRQQRQN